MACLEWLYLHHGWKFFLKLYLLYCSKMASLECLFHQDGWRHFWKFFILFTSPIQPSIIQKLCFFILALQLYDTLFIIHQGKIMTDKLWYYNSLFASLAMKMWKNKDEDTFLRNVWKVEIQRWDGDKKVCKMPVDNIFSRFSYNNFAS